MSEANIGAVIADAAAEALKRAFDQAVRSIPSPHAVIENAIAEVIDRERPVAGPDREGEQWQFILEDAADALEGNEPCVLEKPGEASEMVTGRPEG